MSYAPVLIALGALFLVGLAADAVGRRTRVPRVTLLLLCGIVAGGAGLDLIPGRLRDLYDVLSVTALTMVAFLLGNALKAETLRRHGRAILSVSVMVVLSTVALVAGGLWLLGVPAPVALVLGAIATATDPAATEDALRQSGARGPFARLVRGIVAVDDAWGVLAFALAMVVAGGLAASGGDGIETGHFGHLARALWEIGGALGLGLLIGLPAAFLTGRLSPGEPQLTEALGVVFLTAGLAVWAEVSFLLAGMAAGAVIANRAHHHERAFHEIEHIRWPFMILFFVLAGASLEPGRVAEFGLVAAGYVVLRIAGRLAGGWIGGALGDAPATQRPWYGVALLPQAGVAVGMALIAAREFPDHGELILGLAVATTVVFEVIGPLATLLAVRRTERNEETERG
jgi:Kef-type K+ transport system membrane component KefB